MSLEKSRLAIGDILHGRYVILRPLGKGGMGHVFLVKDMRLDEKLWAVKETKLRIDQKQFLAEVKLLAALEHPYLPKIVDYYPPDEQGYSYLVMDYIRGETLQEKLAGKERITIDYMLKMAIQICEVLHYLHSQPDPIIYRDLKPSNIMIDQQQNIRLIDFGIARHFKEGKLQDTLPLGTVGFAAPEQYQNIQSDHRVDIFALGATLRYILEELNVTDEERSIEDTSNLNEIYQVIDKMTKQSPVERYQRISEVKKELERIEYKTNKHLQYYQPTVALPQLTLTEGYLNDRKIVTISLSITGVNRNVGTTHTAILIANYLAKKGNRVALIEANDSSDFSTIEYVYEGMKGFVSSSNHFSINRVEYYKSLKQINMLELIGKYDYVIFDLGWYEESAWFNEFFRSHVQIVVGSGSEWKQKDIFQFSNSFQAYDQSNWIFCVPFVKELVIKDIKKEIKAGQVYRIPSHPDPYESSSETDEWVEAILGGFLKNKNNKSVLSRVKKILNM